MAYQLVELTDYYSVDVKDYWKVEMMVGRTAG